LEAKYENCLKSNYNRAKLAWYIIDPLFLRNNSTTPEHIRDNPDEQSYHSVREIYAHDVYPDEYTEAQIPTNIRVLNLAFYPNEKGQNNYCFKNEYDSDSTLISYGIDSLGRLLETSSRWSGIMRRVLINNFELIKINKLEFILMDPFADA